MRAHLALTVFPWLAAGCSLQLPDVPPNHPANTDAPAGAVYTVPAVLEVRPILRPPDRPTTRPAHPSAHQSEGFTPMGEMPRHPPGTTGPAHPHEAHHHGSDSNRSVYDVTQTVPAPADDHPAPDQQHTPGKRQQQMIREGQLHE